ncbi:2,5-didehydrogluconate reductase (2-dehydro-L-gulonate-forming) [Aquirufa nivalisilvae]|uniref:2,5-didehydrogluconate reductase (2-dehydro-L-gulonate-forming) n=1 Tax=Aquirufa nivalisilvae TaxID=2516557 RepID=A0A2S2DZP9_9BACT|nr:aldo/keto reductase [Aquirufa nivalisilvae]AWL10490.1 2,5-didehydrogluconate reductase (2-dehydro-L-gulonate-forming) [Aquirufa nivalisilvae]MCZ2479607.1 aldo/keto reductase [Aquirufa nivalisilvae]
MQFVELNNGVKMPILGFGVFQIPDAFACEKSVSEALEVGYRSIDTAASYGNEAAVGLAIKSSGITRQDLFITTKLWIQGMGYEGALAAFDKSMKKLQLDYLDLYLIHQPYGDVFGEWRAMEKLYQEGRIRAIGVSNFQPDRIVDLLNHTAVVPAINQVETHPFQQQIANQQFLQEHQVQIESWGPFAEGKNGMFENPVLASIAQAHGKSIAQIILRWLTQRGIVVIPKTVNSNRMIENFQIFDFSLMEGEMEMIQTLDTNVSSFFDHRDPAMVKWLGTRKIE